MKELIYYSRNAVFEALRANRRQVFSIEIAEGVQEKGKLTEILKLAQAQKIKVSRVPRGKLDKVHENHQGIVAEVSGYPYADVTDILDNAKGELSPSHLTPLPETFNHTRVWFYAKNRT